MKNHYGEGQTNRKQVDNLSVINGTEEENTGAMHQHKLNFSNYT